MGAEGQRTLTGDGMGGTTQPEAPTFPAGRRRILCPACGGAGWDDTYLERRKGDRCRTCQGTGYLWVEWVRHSELDDEYTYIQHGAAPHPDQGELAL